MKKKPGNIFISYTDENKVRMLWKRGKLAELSHLSNNRELPFHQENCQVQTHHLDYIKTNPRAKQKIKASNVPKCLWFRKPEENEAGKECEL